MATTMEDNFKFSLDVHFAQKLAGNFTKIRERTVKKLKKWITARSLKQGGAGMEVELLRLWKGLFYCMWMCDKPVLQEELADKIADLIHSFTTPQGAMAFFDAFLQTMKREWNGIDRLRMDKYFMFVRRCFRQVLVVLKNNDWEESVVDQFLAVLSKTPLSSDPEASPDGLRYHFIDIYREELARCAAEELTPEQVMKLIEPFFALVTTTRNKTLLKVILRGFFQEIVDESDVGFPDDSEDEGIDSGEEDEKESKETKDEEEKEEEEEEDEEEDDQTEEKKKKYFRKERPKLKYDYRAIADRLFTLASQPSTPGMIRKKVYAMVKKFRDLKEGTFPDYNVGSLLDYQDDDDELERRYGDRPPPEKKKKARRRGGKQARERRLAKAQLEAARAAKAVGGHDSDDLDEDDEIDEESKTDKEGKGRKKRRRRRKKRKQAGDISQGTETETVKTTTTTDQKGDLSLMAEKLQVGDAEETGSSEPESAGESKTETPTDKSTKETARGSNTVSKVKASPGLDKTDGRVEEQRRAKKRKSDGGQISAEVPIPDSDSGNNDSKMAAEKIDLGSQAEVKSASAGSEVEIGGERKGKARKKKTNNDETETAESAADTRDAVPNQASEKADQSGSPDQLQTNLSQANSETDIPSSAGKSKQSDGSTLATSASGKLPENRKSLMLPKEGGKRKSEQPFAAFQPVSTPPALVRRRVARKVGEPQTEPPRRKKSRLSGASADSDSDKATPRKQVKIVLGLNKAHASKDYAKQLESSPGIPFDGSKKPTQSALKTPSPKPHPPTGKKGAKPSSTTPSPGVTPSAGKKSTTPTFKTPSPKVIRESMGKSSSKKTRSAIATKLRRSSRIRKQTNL